MTEESAQFRAIVRGRVQGVCYRATTQERGQELGLGGYARNLPDGTVEVVAAGHYDQLSQLITFLQTGPEAAIVESVDIDWDNRYEAPKPFGVRW